GWLSKRRVPPPQPPPGGGGGRRPLAEGEGSKTGDDMALTESLDRGTTDVPLIEQTIGDFFDDMAGRQGTRDALVSAHEKKRLSYLELQREGNRLASAFLTLGLAPGDRVGIWSHNNVPWVLMQIATAKVGIILVN